VAPDYVPLLVELADLLANSSRELDRAAGAAQHALELLETVRAPRAVRADEWTTAVAALRARAHGALGIVRFKKNDGAGAIKEFEQALVVDSSESPALHYRLGRLLAASGQSVKARQHLEAAVKTGGKVLRELAQAALAELP
jgi:tetratricopeptide (TPR) repeat protein